jgi:hypothetical protein
MLVLVPSGGTEVRQGRKLLVDDVVIDYNATLLPDNLVRNPDVDAPQLGSATAPSSWHKSASAVWSDDVALSPTHSLQLNDNSAARTDEWRSYATAIPDGEDRALQLRWFWNHDIEPGSEFRARLRLSTDPAVGSNLTNPAIEVSFPISGTSDGFQMFETSLPIADAIRSFDLTFISGGVLGAIGALFVDDVSAAIVNVAPSLAGDFNGDNVVDAADYVVWRKGMGTTYTENHYHVWRANFSRTLDDGLASQAAVPEPSSTLLAIVISAICIMRQSHSAGNRRLENRQRRA